MSKILNRIGNCNNWICQSKTLQNKYKGTYAKSVDTLMHKVSRKILSIMLGHPTKCAVVDNVIISDKSTAILCIKCTNIPSPAHMQRLNKWLISKYTHITLRGGICTIYLRLLNNFLYIKRETSVIMTIFHNPYHINVQFFNIEKHSSPPNSCWTKPHGISFRWQSLPKCTLFSWNPVKATTHLSGITCDYMMIMTFYVCTFT